MSFSYYQTMGNLPYVVSADSVVTGFDYDGSLTTQMSWQGPVSGTVGFVYDNDFRVTTQTINGADTLGFTYSDDGLITRAGQLSLSYDSQNGLLTADTLGSITGSYDYNSFGELGGTTSKYNASTLFDRSFTRDSLGRIKRITEIIEGDTTLVEYAYNEIGYLVQVKEDGVTTAQYQYDANGNRTATITPTDTLAATYDDQDRMLTYGDAGYTYGKRGELQQKIVGTDTTSYNYDNLGNLRSVVLPDGRLIEYLIDGDGRRVAKKVNGAVTKRWLYASGLIPVAELDSTGAVEKRYGPGYIVKNDTTYRVIRDHLGSVRLITNSQTGEIVQRIDYDAWGNITNLQNPDDFTDIGFAGGLYDRHSGLVRFGARDYDPEVGRWTSKDPILFAGGTSNLYEYVLNDPVNKIDPAGLQSMADSTAQSPQGRSFCKVDKKNNFYPNISEFLTALGYSTTVISEYTEGLLAKVANSQTLLSKLRIPAGLVETAHGIAGRVGVTAGVLSNSKSLIDMYEGRVSKTEAVMDVTFGTIAMMGWPGALISSGYFGPKYYHEYTTGKKMYPDNIFLDRGR